MLVALVSRPISAQELPPKLPALASFRIVQDIAYLAPDQAEKLDLYLPYGNPQDAPAPAVIWMHGNHHDKGEAREHNICETLANAGYICASINYVEISDRSCWRS
jgi:acetyl esterase/lipase